MSAFLLVLGHFFRPQRSSNEHDSSRGSNNVNFSEKIFRQSRLFGNEKNVFTYFLAILKQLCGFIGFEQMDEEVCSLCCSTFFDRSNFFLYRRFGLHDVFFFLLLSAVLSQFFWKVVREMVMWYHMEIELGGYEMKNE